MHRLPFIVLLIFAVSAAAQLPAQQSPGEYNARLVEVFDAYQDVLAVPPEGSDRGQGR